MYYLIQEKELFVTFKMRGAAEVLDMIKHEFEYIK